MRLAPTFQPALGSSRTASQAQANEDGLTFAAHYPADSYAASLASGAARLQVWTNLPISESDAASTSRASSWKAVTLHPVQACLGRKTGYSFTALVRCLCDAVPATYAFTYRIVHTDGQIDWLGSPSNDGHVNVAASCGQTATIQQLVCPHNGTRLQTPYRRDSVQGVDATTKLAALVGLHAETQGQLSFSIKVDSIESGIVVERTKSTWCTSRSFRSPTEVSQDFGSSLIVLKLARSARNEVMVILPFYDDHDVAPRLVRTSCSQGSVYFETKDSRQSQTKISIALGTADKLEQTIAACRSYAARTLRAPIHEPLGIGWSASKALDLDAIVPDTSPDVILPSVPYAYSETDCFDVSFSSDSTAVDSSTPFPRTESTMSLPVDDLTSETDYQGEGEMSDGDQTAQADIRSGPLRLHAGLGFCTWEAMQNERRRPYLSEVVDALEAAEKRLGKGAITALLIDDGWQDVVLAPDHRGRLNSFNMDREMLDLDEATHPNVPILASYISFIRQRFPSIQSVGCWMTLAGYWDGIHPEGPIAADLSAPLRRVSIDDPFRQAKRDWYLQATELDMHLFWDKAFHSLRQSGVDFVKIDAQAEWEWIRQPEAQNKVDARQGARVPPAVNTLSKSAFEAMEGAATRYFGAGGGVVHSMAFTSTLTNTSRTLHNQGMTIRCTDDFFPLVHEAHRHHLAHNVYNSLLLPEHRCDADMLSNCLDEAPRQAESTALTDYTGYHAAFGAFTDARLWISDKLDAAEHASLRALVPLSTLSGRNTKVPVQARGRLLPGLIFDELIGDGVGPALKLTVQHEETSGATVGLWNLRGGAAATLDFLDVRQLLRRDAGCDSPSGALQSRHAVRSFRTGKIWLISSDSRRMEVGSGMLPVTLPNGGWEVLTLAPVLTTMVEGVSAAMLGSCDHFMTPGAIASVTVTTVSVVKGDKRLGRPKHHRSRSSRSAFSEESAASSMRGSTASSALATTSSSAEDSMQNRALDSQPVLLSLALINGFFGLLHATVGGTVQRSRARPARKDQNSGRIDVVMALVNVIDKLQAMVLFALLIFASWASAITASSTRSSWVPAWGQKRLQFRPDVDKEALKRVRLRPVDAVATLKRCLASRTMAPLRKVPVSLVSPQRRSSIPTSSQPQSPTSEVSAVTSHDVLVTANIDMAAKVSFLILCASQDSIKTCTIDRTRYRCSSTPWIKVEAVELEPGSAVLCDQEKHVFRLDVDMKAWLQNQDETYIQTLSAPVSVSIRISASA